MDILNFKTPYLSSRSYLLRENGHGILIDPCELPAVQALIDSGLVIDRAILTHEHDDHIMGVDWVKDTLHAPVLCSDACARNMQDPRINYSYYFELTKSVMEELVEDMSVSILPFSCTATESFAAETTLNWQGHSLLLHETPGHSRGSICILLDDKCLFSGDTLMPVPTGTRFKTGTRKDYETISLPWLKSLDPGLTVYPGHYMPFNLGERLQSEL